MVPWCALLEAHQELKLWRGLKRESSYGEEPTSRVLVNLVSTRAALIRETLLVALYDFIISPSFENNDKL